MSVGDNNLNHPQWAQPIHPIESEATQQTRPSQPEKATKQPHHRICLATGENQKSQFLLYASSIRNEYLFICFWK